MVLGRGRPNSRRRDVYSANTSPVGYRNRRQVPEGGSSIKYATPSCDGVDTAGPPKTGYDITHSRAPAILFKQNPQQVPAA